MTEYLDFVCGEVNINNMFRYLLCFYLLISSKNCFLVKTGFIKSALPLSIFISLDELINSSYFGLSIIAELLNIKKQTYEYE